MQSDIEQGDIHNSRYPEGENLAQLNNKTLREIMVKRQNNEICAVHFWRHKLGIDITEYFDTAHECSKETRLRLLHFKFLHNIVYPTNIMLEKMGLMRDNKCMWCDETDYIEHAFFSMPKTETILDECQIVHPR